jgi:hypothetical protein
MQTVSIFWELIILPADPLTHRSEPELASLVAIEPERTHSRPQSHFHSVTRWKLGSGLHDQMERSDWLLREPANYHAH